MTCSFCVPSSSHMPDKRGECESTGLRPYSESHPFPKPCITYRPDHNVPRAQRAPGQAWCEWSSCMGKILWNGTLMDHSELSHFLEWLCHLHQREQKELGTSSFTICTLSPPSLPIWAQPTDLGSGKQECAHLRGRLSVSGLSQMYIAHFQAPYLSRPWACLAGHCQKWLVEPILSGSPLHSVCWDSKYLSHVSIPAGSFSTK
jgi:hypothetical protein